MVREPGGNEMPYECSAPEGHEGDCQFSVGEITQDALTEQLRQYAVTGPEEVRG